MTENSQKLFSIDNLTIQENNSLNTLEKVATINNNNNNKENIPLNNNNTKENRPKTPENSSERIFYQRIKV